MDRKPVLITGCSSGIGHSTARLLQQRDYRVFAGFKNLADAERLQEMGLETLQLNLADEHQVTAAADVFLQQTQGKCHALINNGAFGQPGAVEDLSRSTLEKQFACNVFGTHQLTNRLLPAMRAAKQGRIIQISSILGLVCLPYRGAYNASKYALEALTDTLRLELVNTGIKVCLVEPGPVATHFRSNAMAALLREIRIEDSAHEQTYTSVLKRLSNQHEVPFTVPPEVVANTIVRALESSNPRLRYRVTQPAKYLAVLKRILPDKIMDRLLVRLGK